MCIVTRESLPLFLLARFPLAKNACRSALTFTLYILAQDDTADPASTSTGLIEKAPVEYGYWEAAAKLGGVPIEVGHQDGPTDAVRYMDWVERVRRWQGWWECEGERGDEVDRGGCEWVCDEI